MNISPALAPVITRPINTIIIHCSATRPSQDIGRAEIDRWHRQQGWKCIGYHRVIRRDGTCEPGRDLNEIGAHAQGHNKGSVGICMVGGVAEHDVRIPEDNFTGAQWERLEELVRWLRTHVVKAPNARIIGRRDVQPLKACPSFSVREWLVKTGIR